MQNNDFDKGIRDLLNSNEPAYNPADWDRMEDLLHQAGATSSPNQGAEGSAGTNAAGSAAQSILYGGKAWMLAAMVALTGVNVAVLVTSQNPSENTAALVSADYAETQIEQTTPEITAEENVEAAQTNAGAITGSEETAEGQSRFSAGLQTQNQTSDKTVASVKSGSNISASPIQAINAKGNQATGITSAVAGKAGNNMGGSFAGAGKAANSGNAGGSFFGGSPMNKAGMEAVSPCAANRKPYLPYLVAGTDTVTNFAFTLKTCEPFCINLTGNDADANDRIIFSAALAQLPGARFETNPENNRQAAFCWTPGAAHARTEPYVLKVNLQNDNCPGFTTYSILLTVSPSAAVRISGDTLLMAGQQTRLRAIASVPEASFKWLPAAGLTGSLNSAEVLASPTQNTTYTLQMTTANGCQLQTTHKIKMATETSVQAVFVPNIFTPNADGVNDAFEVKGMEVGQMDLTVYNRSGKQVYANPRYDNTWNGANLPDGVYTYVLRNSRNGKLFKGMVEINR